MKKPTNLFIIIIVAIACGSLAGFASSFWAGSFWGSSIESITSSKELDLADALYSRANLIISDAKKVVVNQDVKIDETAASLQPVLLSAFKNMPANKDYYVLEEADAYGLILSNDGWILLSGIKDTSNLAEEIKKYTVVSYDKKTYSLDQAAPVKISGDGSIVLAHLKLASNLPVRKMAYASDLKPGTTLLAVSPSGRTMITSLVAKKRTGLQLSSDRPDIVLELADKLGDEFKNSLIFNLGGDFVGFLDSAGDLRPNYVFLPAWRSLVAKKVAVFPLLGVRYLDLSAIKVPALKVTKGAWIKSIDNDDPAIIKNSPVEQAGLKEGDVIIRIDNQEIDSNHDLAEVISAYSAGDSIYVTYDRNGVTGGVELRLGEIK